MPADTIPPLRLEIPEAAQALRISRALLYKRIRSGEIAAQRDGRRTFVTAAELRRYVERSSTPVAA
jgi:excisionase family DNA binding protein